MNNRIHTSTNPFQGDFKRVLCVCSAGILRSPTAAVVLQREFGYNTRPCGCEESYALIPIDEVLCNWASEIVCMDTYHEKYIKDMFDPAARVICLKIPDIYGYMNIELQELILKNYKEITDFYESEKK